MKTKTKTKQEKFHKCFVPIFEKELYDEILEIGTYNAIDKGDLLVDIGDELTCIPLLIQGAVKIMREDHNGDEILLYFLERGDTCAISFANCINLKKSIFRGIAERHTEYILVPISKIEEWLIKYKSFRKFIIDSYHRRLIEMAETIESLTFMKLDERLINYLEAKVKIMRSKNLLISHQEIAIDLHTSRVVISRLLKTLEKLDKIKLGREKILVTNL
jgi:CRP/FNR family transcriptional regulator